LRKFFPCDEEQGSVNTVLGKHKTQLEYAAVGLSHGFVGNSCPQIFKKGDSLFIMNPSKGEDSQDKGNLVSSICTDPKSKIYRTVNLLGKQQQC
ncbi:MAG: hypothetical protein EB163_06985, partial [Nitrososphaeria archaeon]|nr:hypothetical protein [Nitrososphaeria archaeon]